MAVALFPTVTRSSATAKSTARPSCLVGVFYHISREKIIMFMANHPLLHNWPRKLIQALPIFTL